MSSPLAVPGRHDKNSVLTYHEDDMGAVRFLYVEARRRMHLNPPLDSAERKLKKAVSWWNISTQETRAECINEIEKRLGRALTFDEYATLESKTMQADYGLVTYVSVRIEGA